MLVAVLLVNICNNIFQLAVVNASLFSYLSTYLYGNLRECPCL